MEVVGVSILTNERRRHKLERCVDSLIRYCYHRPLVVAVFDNGSTDDTPEWEPPEVYGVEWRRDRSDKDLGCAAGTNRAISMVDDCRYGLHIESDFVHLHPEISGHDRLWLRRAVEFMEEGECDYLYLRRMCDPEEMRVHWWSQWMTKITERRGDYLCCPAFWWSNNPALRRHEALVDHGTLPLDERIDGPKGTPGWSQPELLTKRPSKSWLHHWGVFVHDRVVPARVIDGCGKHGPYGQSTCKYGFYLDREERFCVSCDDDHGIEDMPDHQRRHEDGSASPKLVTVCTIITDRNVYARYLRPCIMTCCVEERAGTCQTCVAKTYNEMLESVGSRFVVFAHPDVEFEHGAIEKGVELLKGGAGAVGLVGAVDGREVHSSGISEPKEVDTLDSCFLMVDKDTGLRFDEVTFDGLHMYVEDYCCQVRDAGKRCVVMPVEWYWHASTTLRQEGTCWGNYHSYKKRLCRKWEKLGRISTT